MELRKIRLTTAAPEINDCNTVDGWSAKSVVVLLEPDLREIGWGFPCPKFNTSTLIDKEKAQQVFHVLQRAH